MNKATKAVLLSALLFPGSGHWFLKRRMTALLLAGISIACLYVAVVAATAVAQDIVDQIQNGQIALNETAITAAVSHAENAAQGRWAALVSYALGICWVVGIIDSYRIGRLEEQKKAGDTRSPLQ
jgi:succinate dehydrogenase hydrophobic anchor subunit